MKFEELKYGDKVLVRHSGKDVSWSSIQELEVVEFSRENKAIKFIIRRGNLGRDETYEWKSVADLNERFEIFDFAG